MRLEPPTEVRAGEFVAAAWRSCALHRGLVSVPATRDAYRAYAERAGRATQRSFLIVATDTATLAGGIDLLEIAQGAGSAARLGYYAFLPHAGRGFMRAGVALAITHAFEELGLAHLVADIQPTNRRSIALAESLGFRRQLGEGRQRKVGRRWLAHERWTLPCERWRAQPHAVPEPA